MALDMGGNLLHRVGPRNRWAAAQAGTESGRLGLLHGTEKANVGPQRQAALAGRPANYPRSSDSVEKRGARIAPDDLLPRLLGIEVEGLPGRPAFRICEFSAGVHENHAR